MALKKTQSGNNDEIAKVTDQLEEEYAPQLNDIPIAEDGYVHDVELLAGYVDKDGVLHKTFSYREMNGKDEEALSRGDIRSNGARLINTLVERCVNQIGTLTKKECGSEWGKIVRGLTGGDLDYIAFKIRELSKGNEIEFTHKCPSCGTKLTTVVNTEEFGTKPFMGQYDIPFTLIRGYKDVKGNIHKEGTIRIPTGLDREIITPLFKKNMSTAMTMLLTRCITFNDGAVVTQDKVNEMSLRDREVLEKILKENAFGVDTSLEITCTSCGEDISGEVGQTNFF